MIYIATVHWQSDAWILPQLNSLKKFINEPFEVFAFLNGIDNPETFPIEHLYTEEITHHAKKLNILADEIIQISESEDDLIVFIDGDAILINPIDKLIAIAKSDQKLAAVQRLENNGDLQPHPCFTITTTGFWKEIKGDWSDDEPWQDLEGNEVFDVGGTLYNQLKRKGIKWHPIHRSNRFNLHVLNYAVYGDFVYHHGSGFRENAGGRVGIQDAVKNHAALEYIYRLLRSILPSKAWIKLRHSIFHPHGIAKRKVIRRNTPIAFRIFQELIKNPDFVQSFISENPEDWKRIEEVAYAIPHR